MLVNLRKGFPTTLNSILTNNHKKTSLFCRKSQNVGYNFSRLKNFKIISDPKDVSKLIFDEEGKCKIF